VRSAALTKTIGFEVIGNRCNENGARSQIEENKKITRAIAFLSAERVHLQVISTAREMK